MINPRDAWHQPYYLEDGSINPECRLFIGVSEHNKQRILSTKQ